MNWEDSARKSQKAKTVMPICCIEGKNTIVMAKDIGVYHNITRAAGRRDLSGIETVVSNGMP